MSAGKLPSWQHNHLVILLDALEGVPISDAERATLTWLAGGEVESVERIAAVIRRAREVRP